MKLLVLSSTLLLFELSVISAHVIPNTKLVNVIDIYEVQENNKSSIRLINPKPDKPVVREIFYYHIIEKPYGDGQSQEGKVITDEGPDFDETRRPFTNSHGHQFPEELNDEESIDKESNVEESNDEESIDEESNDKETIDKESNVEDSNDEESNVEESNDKELIDEKSNVTNQNKELIVPERANVRKDVIVKTEAKILQEPKNGELNVTDENREFVIPDELAIVNADDRNVGDDEVEVPIDDIEEYEEKTIEYEVPEDVQETAVPVEADNIKSKDMKTVDEIAEEVNVPASPEVMPKRTEIIEEKKIARNLLFDQLKVRYQKNRKPDEKPASRRKRETKMPEAPKLGKLNYDSLPEYIRKLISTEKPATIPTIKPQDIELNKYNEEADIKEEIEHKIEDIFANLKPVEEIEDSEDQNEEPRTYGMKLTGDHGYVWNDIWSDPGISYDVGNTDKMEEKDEVKKPIPSPDDIPRPSPNIEPNLDPFEDKDDSDHDIFVNVNKNKPNKNNANETPDLVGNKDETKDILEQPESDEKDLMKNPDGTSEEKTDLNKGLVENIPEQSKLDKNEKDEKNPTDRIDLGNNKEDSKDGEKIKPDQEIDVAKNPDQSDKTQKDEVKDKEEKDNSKSVEGKKPDTEDEATNTGQENKEIEQNKPNTFDELMKNELFWKWLAEWTSTYMDLLTKHTKKIIQEEVKNQMKAYSESHKDDNSNNKDLPLESKKEETKEITPEDSKGPVIKNNTLIVDGKEIPMTHNSNFDDKENEELLKRRKDKDNNKLPLPVPEENKLPFLTTDNKEENKTISNTNNTKTEDHKEKQPISVSAQTIYGNSAGSDDVTNIFIFYTNKDSKQILEEIKPANDSANIFIFEQQNNVTNKEHITQDQDKKPLGLNKENEDQKATINENKIPDKSKEPEENEDSLGQNKDKNKSENNKDIVVNKEDMEEKSKPDKQQDKDQAKVESKPEDKDEAKLENKVGDKTENKDESKPVDKEEAKLENKEESKTENKEESKPENKDESKLKNKEESKTENKDESKPVDKEEAVVENREDSKPGNKDESKPEMKEEAKVENKEESRPANKDESKPEIKEESKPESKDENKAENKEEAKVENKEENKTENEEAKVENKEESKSENKDENKPEKKEEAKVENEPENKDENKRENKVENEIENKDENKPENKEEAKVENKEESKPENKDESEPANKEEAKVENKEESKSENKDENKPQIKDESKLENKDENKPEIKEEAKVENKEENKSENEEEARKQRRK